MLPRPDPDGRKQEPPRCSGWHSENTGVASALALPLLITAGE